MFPPKETYILHYSKETETAVTCPRPLLKIADLVVL